ncbi:MAG: response regulator transcription factor [Deltaproteobacteria bacterium]|nr:response regulator transcription factor [Deltaproteobacteria bacterium]
MRILVVEDEKKIAGFIKRGLKEEGYAVDVAADGGEGYELASVNDYDLIILDIMLPKCDGVTVCKKLRAEKLETPIIMLTAKTSVQDKVTGLDAGANDYLTKPFAFEELLARMRVLLRRAVQPATRLQVADLALDLLSHKVSRADRDIILSSREFALLEYLMRNTGTVVTRTMISEHVWDIDFDTSTNVIDVYINYLRNKIDADFDQKLIQTIRGRGYMLKE